jgi:transposase
MGRSRGGLTTKIHVLVDANGLPITLKLTPGQAHDGKSAEDMLETIGKGQTLIADAAYDSDRLRENLKDRRAYCCIKPISRRSAASYRPRRKVYAQRNRIERFFNKLKHFRAIASRFEKSADNYLALVKLASARIWMRFMSL